MQDREYIRCCSVHVGVEAFVRRGDMLIRFTDGGQIGSSVDKNAAPEILEKPILLVLAESAEHIVSGPLAILRKVVIEEGHNSEDDIEH